MVRCFRCVVTTSSCSKFLNYWTARQRYIDALREAVRRGSLNIVEENEPFVLGDNLVSDRTGEINVHSKSFWVRLYLSYDVGFAEAWMAGDFESPDLVAVMNLWIDNKDTLGQLSSIFHKAEYVLQMLPMRFLNHTISRAFENAAGYDASNDLYQAFLSAEMQYSVPIWSTDLEGKRSPGDLERAQARKIQYILDKARVRPGDRVLEIGTGWGALAIAAAKRGCTVDTLTVSAEQKVLALADKRIHSAGLSDVVTVHLMDHRCLPREFEGKFDACISIEMLEVVGRKYMPTYLRTVDWALKSDRAAAVLNGASFPETLYTHWQGIDFVRKYHWPNGVSPSATSLVADAYGAWAGKMSLESVDDLGPHYARCLREWERRLDENWGPELVTKLTTRHPELKDEKQLLIFRRKWDCIFKYYARGYLCNHCWMYVRPVSTLVSRVAVGRTD
ncbi:cyclopropane-fatty-acyl-phospholipid synthase [Neolentinus lepideus HHB14362 ss-1]|uniref:Cyclopropane-fatty-acyl-phospholipid synthase n=1 Tax=Neolentinus lepideus HHB14362 ss-1 TaxID=1314782 RepID=A0A165MGA4_9AGAM|nr:cyclopropane-fatty-acyl-phospholipid synthase [Neolentinus lepideus HHB14362 ss-1]